MVKTGNPLYMVPGLFASLWTPCTSDKTIAVLAFGPRSIRGILTGREFKVGKNIRIAPFGNRTKGKTIKDTINQQIPHYHRKKLDLKGKTLPGQGIGRHRPLEKKSPDKSFLDRF
ncbi:hypothetical protein GWN91_03175 [Candidatus Saccharibacteria bacterium]|nr:hypothetical protein [Candidatus Saccharibacteria bacterium]NIV71944.1 hypothetical protein [Calditrichia bacterium]